MTLKMGSQRHNMRETLICGELTPPRSDSSEPSLSPAPAPLSPPSPAPPVIKEEPELKHCIREPIASKDNGMSDTKRLTLCAFVSIFLLTIQPLHIMKNSIKASLPSDWQYSGRTILNYDGLFLKLICKLLYFIKLMKINLFSRYRL